MSIIKKLTALFLALILIISVPVSTQAATEDSDTLIRDLINYFQHYQWDAETDYILLLDQMAQLDPALAETWSGILDFWIYLNRDMEVHNPVLPDGLPEDDSLCIAVMGYYLKSDGGIRDELYERLHVTLASAQKYPNAYILCTGGSTASQNSRVSEASQMAKWLIKKGVPEDRIILEDQARSTIDNAQFGCALLYRDYPQVNTLAVITSDYHIFRSCLYFNTQSAMDAYELGIQPMKVVASATCRIKPNAPSDIETQVEGMSILTNLDVEDMAKPKLTELERIEVAGTQVYEMGSELDLVVSAVYSTGYSREVTDNITYSEIDFEKEGIQTVDVSYREGNNTKTASFDIEILPAPTEMPIPSEPETPPAESAISSSTPAVTEPESSDSDLTVPLMLAGICVLLLILLLYLKHRQAKKRRRRSRPSMNLD